ncbi:hypothetical protein AB0K09_13440 [Streptomyces sp. NPDC049577]|uniref:hypothetical protein n=1 Tax=Streptomyces sp. NPDC049577 TaxID=3155153 RepID=UPI0034389F21
MPRGRHRHSAPLHRLLPPATVAATSVVCAAGALVVGETAVIRGLAAAAAAAAVVGSVLMRRWDRAAGKRVAQLTAARTRDEWKTDERIAELETDLEETRLARTALEAKLRAKRAELARLRTEHADLLRRYAAAETGRASALEGQRKLSKDGAKGGAKDGVTGGVKGGRAAAALPAGGTGAGAGLTPAAYREAAEALRRLERNAARQRAAQQPARAAAPKALAPAPVPAQTPARVPVVRQQGGFDFFGTRKKPVTAAKPVEEVEGQDLADVVGEEALAEAAEAEIAAKDEKGVIDLTAHDETEQIDVAELRSAIS